jgi:hypothetical protein
MSKVYLVYRETDFGDGIPVKILLRPAHQTQAGADAAVQADKISDWAARSGAKFNLRYSVVAIEVEP